MSSKASCSSDSSSEWILCSEAALALRVVALVSSSDYKTTDLRRALQSEGLVRGYGALDRNLKKWWAGRSEAASINIAHGVWRFVGQ